MKLVNLIQEDFTNYKKPSMFIGFPKCSGKCNIFNGYIVCQNEQLHNAEKIEISIQEIIELYKKNSLIHALVCGGLEPLDSPEDLISLIKEFRKEINDDIVIYTGYTEAEVKTFHIYGQLLQYNNIIIKYGRYIPNQKPHYDEVLGVNLASNNQYARIISDSKIINEIINQDNSYYGINL